MTWLASLMGGQEIIAEAADLQALYEQLQLLELADNTTIVAFWMGDEDDPAYD